jgi:EAL domain-containing protein (putative c-di-GMP-specific phosphodiesterase class I)
LILDDIHPARHPADAQHLLSALSTSSHLEQPALDGFGTGYSSVNYVRQFQFDSVKLDGTLTATIATDKVARSTRARSSTSATAWLSPPSPAE